MTSARFAAGLHPVGAVLLAAVGPIMAVPFVLLHGGGNGLLTIARGTLPLWLFGSTGDGLRTGILSAPARILQGTAPLVFGLVLDRAGPPTALHLSSSLMAASLFALLLLRSSERRAAPAASPSSQTQLDRIEGKLDDILRRLPPPNPGQTAASPAPAQASAAPQEADQPGLLVFARPAPHDQRSLPDVPTDSVGGFVYAGGPLPLSDPSNRGVVHYTGAVGYERQGWLRARELGRVSLVLGAYLSPGLYTLRA